MAYIHGYKGDVTSGDTDGTLISEGTELSPIQVGPLNATDNEESAPIKLALRCEAGYLTSGNTTITPVGTSVDKWRLAKDNAGSPGAWGSYGASLVINSVITDVNTVFWAQAKATSDEAPSNDNSVDLQIEALIGAQ